MDDRNHSRLSRLAPLNWTRRRFLQVSLSGAAGLLLVGCSDSATKPFDDADAGVEPTPDAAGDVTFDDAMRDAASDATGDAADVLPPTPQCEESEDNIEGPFYRDDAPERPDLSATVDGGEVLLIAGTVRSTDCTPLAGALIDVWQADDEGVYDANGWRLRGRMFTDAQGRYELTTVVPGHYAGRPRHIHVKVSADGHQLLTTQLYFPDDPFNATDPFIKQSLIMEMSVGDDGTPRGRFDFVLGQL